MVRFFHTLRGRSRSRSFRYFALQGRATRSLAPPRQRSTTSTDYIFLRVSKASRFPCLVSSLPDGHSNTSSRYLFSSILDRAESRSSKLSWPQRTKGSNSPDSPAFRLWRALSFPSFAKFFLPRNLPLLTSYFALQRHQLLTGERRSSFLASPQSRNHAPFCTVSNDRTGSRQVSVHDALKLRR
jgi:hypothetical protein